MRRRLGSNCINAAPASVSPREPRASRAPLSAVQGDRRPPSPPFDVSPESNPDLALRSCPSGSDLASRLRMGRRPRIGWRLSETIGRMGPRPLGSRRDRLPLFGRWLRFGWPNQLRPGGPTRATDFTVPLVTLVTRGRGCCHGVSLGAARAPAREGLIRYAAAPAEHRVEAEDRRRMAGSRPAIRRPGCGRGPSSGRTGSRPRPRPPSGPAYLSRSRPRPRGLNGPPRTRSTAQARLAWRPPSRPRGVTGRFRVYIGKPPVYTRFCLAAR